MQSPRFIEPVLIADDDKAIRDLLVRFLEQEGFSVLTADNGEEVVTLALEKHPDLICLDIIMPRMDGYDAADFIKNNADTSHIPIIFITSKADREYKVFSRTIGVVEYITKPFDIEVVLNKIKLIITSGTGN